MWPGFESQRRRRIRRMWVEFDVRSQSCLRREGFLSVSSVFNSPKKTDIFKLQFDLELSVVS